MRCNLLNYNYIISSADYTIMKPASIGFCVLKFLSKSADCFSSIISIVTHLAKYKPFLPDFDLRVL